LAGRFAPKGVSNAHIDVEELRRRINERVHPFLGNDGIGSRISVEKISVEKKKTDGLVRRGSRRGQLMLLFGLALFSRGLTCVDGHQEGGRRIPKNILAGRHHARPILVNSLGYRLQNTWLRILRGRPIEINNYTRTVALYSGGRRAERLVSCDNVDGFDIVST
jgi:hypothetical protein